MDQLIGDRHRTAHALPRPHRRASTRGWLSSPTRTRWWCVATTTRATRSSRARAPCMRPRRASSSSRCGLVRTARAHWLCCGCAVAVARAVCCRARCSMWMRRRPGRVRWPRPRPQGQGAAPCAASACGSLRGRSGCSAAGSRTTSSSVSRAPGYCPLKSSCRRPSGYAR